MAAGGVTEPDQCQLLLSDDSGGNICGLCLETRVSEQGSETIYNYM